MRDKACIRCATTCRQFGSVAGHIADRRLHQISQWAGWRHKRLCRHPPICLPASPDPVKMFFQPADQILGLMFGIKSDIKTCGHRCRDHIAGFIARIDCCDMRC